MGILDSLKRSLSYDIKNHNGLNEEFGNIKDLKGNSLKKKYYKKNGEYHGKYQEFIHYEGNICLAKEISYKNGIKDGLTRTFYNNKIFGEANYINGKETGILKIYFKESRTIIESSADLDNRIYEVFNKEGKLLEKSEIDGATFRHEQFSSYNSNGPLTYIYPIRDGLYEKWFENGQLRGKGFFVKEKLKGKYIEFYENGNTKELGEWTDGVPTGLHKLFYLSGNIQFEIESKNSEERWFNEDGSLMTSNQIIEKGNKELLAIKENIKEKIRLGHMSVNFAYYGKNEKQDLDTMEVIINNMRFSRIFKYKLPSQLGIISFHNFHSYSYIDNVINSIEELEEDVENQNMIPNEHLKYIPSNQNIKENEEISFQEESKIYEAIAEEREFFEVSNPENIFYGFWIDIHIENEGLHIEGVDYYGNYPVIETKDENDSYNYFLIKDIPYKVETENSIKFHHCDDFKTEKSAMNYLDEIKVMKYKDALKKGLIPASKNNDEVIKKDKSAEIKDTELSENIDIKVIPNWFEGEVLSKGDIVKNQDGIAISLTSVELSIYNLLIEHCIIIKMGLHKEIILDEMNKCVNWLRQNTSKKQYIFMLKEAYRLAETKRLKELIDKEESTKDVIEIVEEENKPAPTVDLIKSLTEFADKENIPLEDNKEASKMINEETGKINEITKEEKYNSIVDELTKLGALKEKGLLTEEEFNEQKKKLLKQ